MLEKFKNHSVKIFVFAINVFIMAIAVLIIREKDQARLLEKAREAGFGSGNASDSVLPSFESSIGAENQWEDNNAAVDAGQASGSTIQAPPENTPTAAPAPVPAQSAKPSNAKTKTS